MVEEVHNNSVFRDKCKVKGKEVPLQAWSGPECSRKLRFLDNMATAQDGGDKCNLLKFLIHYIVRVQPKICNVSLIYLFL